MRPRRALIVVTALGLLATWNPAVHAATAVPSPSAPTSPSAAATASPAPETPPAPPTTDPLAQQLAQAAANQQLLQQTKSSLSSEISSANAQQEQMAQLLISDQKQIQQTLQQLATEEAAYASAQQQQAAALTAEHLALAKQKQDQALLAESVDELYVNHGSTLAYVLSGASLSQDLDREATMSHIAASIKTLTASVNQDVANAAAAARAAAVAAAQAQAAAAGLSLQENQLQQQTAKAHGIIARLSIETGQAMQTLSQVNAQNLALAQKIASLRIQQLDNTIAQAEQEDWQAAEFYIQHHLSDFPFGAGQPVQVAPSPNGQMIWPAPKTFISQPFGPTDLTLEPPMFGYPHFHTGIDLAGTMGSPIYAAAGGVVAAADTSNVGYGNHIIIASQGGILTLYGHLETMLVAPGQPVQQGQLIGLMGSTGNSTGPHCHFEVRVNNIPVNPLPYLPPLPPGATGPATTNG